MNTSMRYKLAALGLLVLVGGGCLATKKEMASNPEVMPSDTKPVEIGQGISMNFPTDWVVSIHEGLVYVNACGTGVEADSIFCKNNILVSNAPTGPEALLEFSKKYREWAWFCPGAQYGECLTDEDKLKQVEKREGFWTASSLGIAENAAIAFEYEGKYVVIFGGREAEIIYKEFAPRLK